MNEPLEKNTENRDNMNSRFTFALWNRIACPPSLDNLIALGYYWPIIGLQPFFEPAKSAKLWKIRKVNIEN